MDVQILVLRILHIVLGTFWVGTDVFYSFFLLPHLRSLGPAIERPAAKLLRRPSFVATIGISATATVVTGVLLIGKTKGWSTLFASGWGVSIFIGLILTGIAVILAFALVLPVTTRAGKLDRIAEERPLTADESRQMDDLGRRELLFSRTGPILLLIAVVTMAIARVV